MQNRLKTIRSSIDEIRSNLLTSDDIVSRILHPNYMPFLGNAEVPKELHEFKQFLYQVRSAISEHVKRLPTINVGGLIFNFSEIAFPHKFVYGLATAYFGIGECGECTFKLAENLIPKNFRNYLFVELQFTNAKPGMEPAHSLLITAPEVFNMPPILRGSSLENLLAKLPSNAIVADAFLKEAFGVKEKIPQRMIDYFKAYGGNVEVVHIDPIMNYPNGMLNLYQGFVSRVVNALRYDQGIASQQPIKLLSGCIKLGYDTRLLEMLKEMLKLEFCGYRDDNFYVYAVALINNPENMKAAIQARSILPQGAVTFFRDSPQSTSVVVNGINLPEVSSHIDRHYQATCGKL